MSQLQERDVKFSGSIGPRDIGQSPNPIKGMCIDNKNHLQGLSNQNADPAELHNMIAKVFSDYNP